MEIFKNFRKGKEADNSEKKFPEDLRRLVVERQDLKKRIKGLEMDMNLVASVKDQRYSSDDVLRKELGVNDKILAKEIFDLCGKYEIETIRFLSTEEIDQFSSNNMKKKDS